MAKRRRVFDSDAESGRELIKLQMPFEGRIDFINSVAFSSDGKKVVTGSYKIARIWDLSAEVKRWTEVDEGREAERKAGFFDLHMERQNDLQNEFVQFGSSELRDKLQAAEEDHRKADAFDRADAQAKLNTVKSEIGAAKAEIAKKRFYDEYSYSAPPDKVQVDGDKSSFTMEIPTEFSSSKVDEVLFPMTDVIGKIGSGRQGTVLTVSGSTNSIRELVRGSDNYRARVWFTNLRQGNNAPTADVLKIEIIKVQ
jgi:WD40 repeat protein